jgi:hypothetical protein
MNLVFLSVSVKLAVDKSVQDKFVRDSCCYSTALHPSKATLSPLFVFPFLDNLREENRPRVFDNRVLRRIFGPKRDDVMGDWRKLHNEELHNLYSSPDIMRMIKSGRMRRAGHAPRMGDKRNAYRILVGKPERRRPLRRPRRRWVDNIKMDFKDIG